MSSDCVILIHGLGRLKSSMAKLDDTFIAANPVVIKEAVEFLKQKSKQHTKY